MSQPHTKSGQANLGNGNTAAVKRTLTILKEQGCKAIALCEAGDRMQAILDWCKENDWSAFFGHGEGAASTPLIWDNAITATHLGTHPATPATNTGPLGAGPNVVKAKVLNHGRFHEKGHAPFVLIGLHMPASLYLPKRRALAKIIVREVVDMVEPREGHVEVRVVGDFNCRPSALILKPLRKAGLIQHTHKPTHKAPNPHRCIDQSWTFGPAHAEVVVIASDHRGVTLLPLH